MHAISGSTLSSTHCCCLCLPLVPLQWDPRKVNPWQQEVYIYNAGEAVASVELNGKPLKLAG